MLPAPGDKVNLMKFSKLSFIWTASSILTLQMSSDETSIYALSSDGEFSAWSFIQTSQKMFEVQLNDPYFSSDSYPRAAWGKQFAFAGNFYCQFFSEPYIFAVLIERASKMLHKSQIGRKEKSYLREQEMPSLDEVLKTFQVMKKLNSIVL